MDVIERGRAEVGKVDAVLKDMGDEIERLRAVLARLCYYWDENLNNLDDGPEYEARQAAQAVLMPSVCGEKSDET